MSTNYTKHFSTIKTPQSEKIPGSKQVPNSAGGFAFAVDDWTRLDRFLILGCEGNSYYASAKKLTVENAQSVQRCLDADYERTVGRIVEISTQGRAAKNDAAIFALAMVAAVKGKTAAMDAIPLVCRTGTHLFQFVESVRAFRGEGRSLLRGIRNWYLGKEPEAVEYQVIKYQQRNGWSHKDILRLCHPKTDNEALKDIFHWIVKGWDKEGEPIRVVNSRLDKIYAFEKAKRSTDKKEICSLIRDYNLPRECIPTQFLKEAEVWEALLEKMPMTAMIRNLATMTRVGLIAPLSAAAKTVAGRLVDDVILKKARVHPIAVLNAMLTYKAGRGVKGKSTWSPVSQVVDALDAAFYKAFGNVPSTGQNWLLGLDISGSMGCCEISGVPGLTPRVASCAMAMVTAATEPNHVFAAFTSSGWSGGRSRGQYSGMGYNNGVSQFDVSPRERLDAVCAKTAAMPMGGTDCALPMLWAMENKIEVDNFVIYTDSETWHGDIHPVQALQQYRNKMGRPSKLIVCGMVANEFSIADSNDAGMLDVVGFDSNTPALMTDFATGGSSEKDQEEEVSEE